MDRGITCRVSSVPDPGPSTQILHKAQVGKNLSRKPPPEGSVVSSIQESFPVSLLQRAYRAAAW